MNKHKIYNNCLLIIILLFGLIPLLWYKSGYIIAKGDFFPHWYNSLNTFSRDIFVWESTNSGQISNWPQYSIFGGIWYFLQMMCIPPNRIQIAFGVFYCLGAGLAMYFLASTIYEKQKIASFMASIFYMFNFFMLSRIPSFAISWTLVFLPLLLAFYIRIVRNIKDSRNTIRNVIGFAFISTILSSFASINPPLLALIFIAWFLVFLYYSITEKAIRTKIIKSLLVLSIIVFLINIWWVISFLTGLFSLISGSTAVIAVVDVTEWAWTHRRASFLNLFWLNGRWSWTSEYFPYIDVYSNPILRLLVFIPMMLAFVGFLFKDKYRKINLYFGIVILFLMFLAKGIHPPLGSLNLLFYKHIPGFFLFREPFAKFYIILIPFLALLIGSSCNTIIEYIEKEKISYRNTLLGIFTVFIPISFLISAFPLITGEVITKETKEIPFSSYIKIPRYYYEASNYINSETIEDSKILLTPQNDFYALPYRWGYYGINNLVSRLIMRAFLEQPYGYVTSNNYENFISLIYDQIDTHKEGSFVKLLSLLNGKYILQRNDVWWDFGNRNITPPGEIQDFLPKQEGLHFEKSFDKLDLYKISDEYFLPHIYAYP